MKTKEATMNPGPFIGSTVNM